MSICPHPHSVLAVRRVNDQLMQLERHFIDPHGLPNRPEYKYMKINLIYNSFELILE
jgi:hypothetical protein